MSTKSKSSSSKSSYAGKPSAAKVSKAAAKSAASSSSSSSEAKAPKSDPLAKRLSSRDYVRGSFALYGGTGKVRKGAIAMAEQIQRGILVSLGQVAAEHARASGRNSLKKPDIEHAVTVLLGSNFLPAVNDTDAIVALRADLARSLGDEGVKEAGRIFVGIDRLIRVSSKNETEESHTEAVKPPPKPRAGKRARQAEAEEGEAADKEARPAAAAAESAQPAAKKSRKTPAAERKKRHDAEAAEKPAKGRGAKREPAASSRRQREEQEEAEDHSAGVVADPADDDEGYYGEQ